MASSCNDVTSVNGPTKSKNKGQRLKIIEVENSDDVNDRGNVVSVDCNDNESGESHIDSYKCSGKEILEDLKIVNSDNKENEEVRMDNTSNDVMVDGLKNTKSLQSKDNITLEIPEDVKILMDKATANYKMGHYADALKIYSKCFDILWPGIAVNEIYEIFIIIDENIHYTTANIENIDVTLRSNVVLTYDICTE